MGHVFFGRKRRRSSATSLDEARGIQDRIGFRAAEARFDSRYLRVSPEVVESSCMVWGEHLRTILCGTRSPDSPLSLLRGYEDTLVRAIYMQVVSSWKSCITQTIPAREVGRMNAHRAMESSFHQRDDVDAINRFQLLLDEETYDDPDFISDEPILELRVRAASVRIGSTRTFSILGLSVKDRPPVAFTPCSRSVDFPTPKGLNVKMMPFVMGDRHSLPQDLQPYYDSCILNCAVMPAEIGKVCYSTVAEGLVQAQDRQCGIRVEVLESDLTKESRFVAGVERPPRWTPRSRDELHGGLFMACNMAETYVIWNAIVDTTNGDFDSRRGLEHIRPYLGRARKLGANELTWLTAQTPHEMVQENEVCRQLFRLVTSDIAIWHEGWTPNPMVPLPGNVRMIKESNFDEK